jgi:hypothetical protein
MTLPPIATVAVHMPHRVEMRCVAGRHRFVRADNRLAVRWA